MSQNKLSPPLFPAAWASEFGEDCFGLWMAFTVKSVRQVFRWIAPGTFAMGSPEDEAGRWHGYETLHTVTLSQGFWLADSTVTQALWQAVMDGNPSGFQGGQRPVEHVSWDEAQDFIKRLSPILQRLQAEYAVRLPTEAEWEYACRAGTQSAFNFDGELSLDKVNYRGTWQYKTDEWGQGALKQTCDVKFYPCNAWGLYEMHGNVWEWCQDRWASDLGGAAVTDPAGPLDGAGRVVRGGSWFSYGQAVRSANRFRLTPDGRNDFLGFRLALGLELRPGRQA